MLPEDNLPEGNPTEDNPTEDNPPEVDDRWFGVLDRLEDGLAEALAAMDRPAEPFSAPLWTPPADMGPLPPELQPRVEALIAAKEELRGRMAAAQASTASRLAAMASVPRPSASARPVYLDISG